MKSKNNKKFDIFDEFLKIVIVKGLIALGILFLFGLLLIFLSVATYASQVQNTMSFSDYLYSQNHTILKFILFLVAGFSVVILIGVFLASLMFCISLKAWRSLSILSLIVGIFIFLFLVPFHQTKTMYAAEISIKPEYIRKHSDEFFFLTARTNFYLSYEEAKDEVEQNSYIGNFPRNALVLKKITKSQEVSHPIVYIEFPKNPHNNDGIVNGGW